AARAARRGGPGGDRGERDSGHRGGLVCGARRGDGVRPLLADRPTARTLLANHLMYASLVLGGLAMGVAATPHCALMCGGPCAAWQGALLLSALARSPQRGALVMAGFAVGSMPALLLARWVWARWSAWRGKATSPAGLASLGLRLAGAGLVLASGWALMEL